MTDTAVASVIDLAAGAMVLAAVLIVWRRDLRYIIGLLAWQGAALAVIPIIRGAHEHDATLIVVGAAIAVLRAVALPWLLIRALGAEHRGQREATPLVNTTASLLIAALLTVLAFGVTRPVVNLDPAGPSTGAVPAAFAVVLIALFVMTTRRHAISQAAGFLMLDNGIAATAFLLTAGVPLIVEFGASLDVLFGVIVIGVLTGRMRRKFGGADLDALQELHD
jgi:hydrogenase-4 component E